MAKERIDIKNKKFTDEKIFYFVYEPVNFCPRCKHAISPVNVSHLAFDHKNELYVSLFDFCTNCCSSILNTYICSVESGNLFNGKLISSEPVEFTKQNYDEDISNLSPQFIKIYNQALAAEVSKLDEIAGLGYRKALEFLIKDFAIYENQNDEAKIKSMSLSQCIKTYISNNEIKTLAERSAWIGNDEAHYVRKQEDRDVSDMKKFIQATVYFIGMILITEDASSMESKK